MITLPISGASQTELAMHALLTGEHGNSYGTNRLLLAYYLGSSGICDNLFRNQANQFREAAQSTLIRGEPIVWQSSIGQEPANVLAG